MSNLVDVLNGQAVVRLELTEDQLVKIYHGIFLVPNTEDIRLEVAYQIAKLTTEDHYERWVLLQDVEADIEHDKAFWGNPRYTSAVTGREWVIGD